MDAIKGLARRMTQTVREKVSNAESSTDDKLNDATRKIRAMEKSAVILSDKILRAAKLIDELAGIFRDVSEEMKLVPDLLPEIQSLVDETSGFATVVTQKVPEHQASLKDQAFDPLGNFIREVAKLRDAEEDRKKKQLEFDFFKQKVLELRRNPPKDFTRIPRNEHTLEQWRVELWKSTESNKALVSTLFAQGQRSIDQSLMTLGQTCNSFYGILASGLKHTFGNVRCPLYSPAPLLQPEPLPPNPLPPFVYPQQQQPGVPGTYDQHSPPNHQAWASQPGSPPQQQQQQPQQQWGSPPQQSGPPAWGQQPQQYPQQQQGGWNPQQPQQQPHQQPAWGAPQAQPTHQYPPVQWQPSQQQQAPPQPQQQPPPQSQQQQQPQSTWNQPTANSSSPQWSAQPTWQPTAPASQPESAPTSHVAPSHEVQQPQPQQTEVQPQAAPTQ